MDIVSPCSLYFYRAAILAVKHAPISFILSWSLSVRSLVSMGGGSAKLLISIFQNFLPGLDPHRCYYEDDNY